MRGRDARPEVRPKLRLPVWKPLRLSPCRSRVLSDHPVLPLSVFPSPFTHFLRLLLFPDGDGSTNASERGQVQIVTRAPGCERVDTRAYTHAGGQARTQAHGTDAHSQIYAGTKETSCRTYRRPSHCWLISELRGRKAGRERKRERGNGKTGRRRFT